MNTHVGIGVMNLPSNSCILSLSLYVDVYIYIYKCVCVRLAGGARPRASVWAFPGGHVPGHQCGPVRARGPVAPWPVDPWPVAVWPRGALAWRPGPWPPSCRWPRGPWPPGP